MLWFMILIKQMKHGNGLISKRYLFIPMFGSIGNRANNIERIKQEIKILIKQMRLGNWVEQ